MQYFLGIDGGGTGCRARLIEASGRTLAEASGGPANISSNREGARDNILALAQDCLQAAGLTPKAPIGVVMGLAGVNVSGTVDWLTPQLPFGALRIVTDAFTMTMGALQGTEGIVAAIGTGSVFARWHQGRYSQFGGWGFALGDEGSGAVLGRMLLARALRAHDGVVAMTPLLAQVLAQYPSPEAIAAFAAHASPADYAKIAPQLLIQDPASAAIWTEAGGDVAAMIARIQSLAPLPVTWVGGLGPAWQARLGQHWDISPAKGTSLDGAVLLARQIFGKDKP